MNIKECQTTNPGQAGQETCIRNHLKNEIDVLLRDINFEIYALHLNKLRLVLYLIKYILRLVLCILSLTSYLDTNNLEKVDSVKRSIITLYEDDFNPLPYQNTPDLVIRHMYLWMPFAESFQHG